MHATPDIAAVAALIGDPTRATMLMGLMAGRPLTAGELAATARVTKQTASSHLSKLVAARLVTVEEAGRHRYFRLAGADVGAVLERLMGLAQRTGAVHASPGPADPALRKARVCYDHLAGDLGVLVFDRLREEGLLVARDRILDLSDAGEEFCRRFGIDLAALSRARRPLCLPCLDWSVRRPHLAGAVGAAILDRCLELGWARRQKASRTVIFSATGERSLRARLQRPALHAKGATDMAGCR